MLRLWTRVIRHNKIIEETVTASSLEDERAALAEALQEACVQMDIARPLWLSINERDIEEYRRTTLNQDNFLEDIRFDRMELEILEDEDQD
jgi:hypothetical protein